MTLLQLQREGPRLVNSHPNLIWKKSKAERRFKQRHSFTLEAEQRYVVDCCVIETCEQFHVTMTALFGTRRFRHLINGRHIAMTVAYELSGLSSIVLGVKFQRGHDMILWAQNRVNSDRGLRKQADEVIRAVKKQLRCK